MKKIAIVGATGYTGRLTCEKLLEQGVGNDVRIVLGGRDRHELERLSLDVGRRFKQAVDIHVFDFADRPSLRVLCDNATVVINCAAPYSVSGAPVLATAVHCKAHLIDASNETAYIEQCSMRAAIVKEAGVAVINGLAVDPGLADLAAAIAAKQWEAVNSVNILYICRDVEETLGVRASTLENFKQPCRVYQERALQTVKVASQKHEFKWDGGGAKGRSMPGGEPFLLPRHLSGVRNVSMYRVLEGRHGMFIGMLGGPLASVGMLMVGKWAKEGSRPTVDASQFVVVVEVEGIKRRRFAVVQGKGVYTATAALLAEAARRLCNDGPKMSGVLSPAQAFEPASLLKACGLEVQVADAAAV